MLVEEARKQLKGTKVHAVAIQKGGTGKTINTLNLAGTFYKMNKNLLDEMIISLNQLHQIPVIIMLLNYRLWLTVIF